MPTTINGDTGVSQVQNNPITQADLTTAILPLGVGQNWSNMTAVRSAGVTYTNDTGRPIVVVATGLTTNTVNTIQLICQGVLLGASGVSQLNNTMTVTGVIPTGAQYIVQAANVNVTVWSELR